MVLFKINSKTLSRNPSNIEYSTLRLEKSDRTIDGTLIVDLIAIKDKVSFTWNYLPDADLKKLVGELKLATFSTIEYVDVESDDGQLKTLIAESGDILYKPRYNARTKTLDWVDVKVAFTGQ